MVYYLFHKPRGCITANRDPRHKTVLDYFPNEWRNEIFPVGRLDRDTEGLLLLTDDGTLTAHLLDPRDHVEKTYFFWCIGEMTDEKQAAIENGMSIDGGLTQTKPAKLEICEKKKLGDIFDLLNDEDKKRAVKHMETSVFSGFLTITEGKKHQVKRMLGMHRCHVVYLKRVKMGSLSLDETLAPGTYRPLTDGEISALKANR
ncbi:MAG: pseudouridine synthase [Clostridia bacterium]|nr:pseudouridine synthase [Clostridia bacterium]